jgi:hypothetical protein
MATPKFVLIPEYKARTSEESAAYLASKGIPEAMLRYSVLELRADGGTEKSAARVKGFYDKVNNLVKGINELAAFMGQISKAHEAGLHEFADSFGELLMAKGIQNTGHVTLLCDEKKCEFPTQEVLAKNGFKAAIVKKSEVVETVVE